MPPFSYGSELKCRVLLFAEAVVDTATDMWNRGEVTLHPDTGLFLECTTPDAPNLFQVRDSVKTSIPNVGESFLHFSRASASLM